MLSGGTQDNPLGAFDVAANDFTLFGTLWVAGYRIDGLGTVALSGHTLNAQDPGASNTINAVGNVTGSTASTGSVQVSSGGDVSASVTAQGPASVSGANVTGTIAGHDVTVAAQSGASASVTAQNNASVSGANVSGSISGTNVTVAAQSSASASVTAQNSASVTGTNVSGNISGSTVTVAAQDASVSVTAGSVTIQATNTVQATVTARSAQVQAGGSATISGSSSALEVDAPVGSVSGSFDEVSNLGTGLIAVNGRPQVNTRVASNIENVSRVIPPATTVVGNVVGTAESRPRVVPTVQLTTPEDIPILRAPPSLVGEHIVDGWAVEIDLSPRLDEPRE